MPNYSKSDIDLLKNYSISSFKVAALLNKPLEVIEDRRSKMKAARRLVEVLDLKRI